jgi:hypothetical protein
MFKHSKFKINYSIKIRNSKFKIIIYFLIHQKTIFTLKFINTVNRYYQYITKTLKKH